ncbi:MAG: hypothetical protein HKN76_11935 [Saprospiraceae bacterium]|nr:hypothetical protein [Saprospiraceae bacterium]
MNFSVRFISLVLILIAVTISGLSCLRLDEISDLTLEESNPFLAFPLATVEVSSDDFIEELQKTADVRLNEDNIYTAFFQSDPFVQNKQDLFPKTTFGLPIPILDSVVSLPVPILEETSLSKGILKGDQLIFALNSNESDEVTVTMKIDELTKNGEVFNTTFSIPFDGEAPSAITTEPIDLDGFEVDFSRQFLTLQYDARNESGDRIVLPISFAQITAFDFSYLEGNIATSEIPLGVQTIDIDIQDTLIAGNYQFENPKIHFKIANSFGIPIGIRVKEVFIIGANLERKRLESSLFSGIINLQFPQFDQQGLIISDQITFDKNNSNVLAVARDDITSIEYDLDVIINPDNLKDALFFVLDSSRAVVNAEVEMSFNATVENVTVQKSVNIDPIGLDTLSYLRLKLVVENGIPFSFEPSLLLEDSVSGNSLRLTSQAMSSIVPAPTDMSGKVVEVSQNTLYFELNEQQLEQVGLMNLLTVELKMQSPEQGNLPAIIQPGQVMKVRVGAEANFK